SGPRLLGRPPRSPACRPRRRAPWPRAHRRHAQPHPHRGLPLAHRRGPGARPRLALRDRVAQAVVRGAALVPHRRRRDLRGGGPARRSVALSTRALGFAPPTTDVAHMAVYSSILDLIGNTPMVDVSSLSP